VRWIAAKFGELLCGENRVGERGEMGRGKCSGTRLCPLEAEARGGEKRGSWARASARRFEAETERERENGRAVGGDRADRRARPISGWERAEGGGVQLGRGPRRGERARGSGPKGRKKRERGRKAFSFLFFQTNFQTLFQNGI